MNPGLENLAPFAITPAGCGGRAHPEPPDPLRDPFVLDCHRIIESTAFRRLEGKTQVFAPDYHDHFRTRLTHTLEVAEIAATLARLIGANEMLARAITLAHDLGHPPFGHAGEVALAKAMEGHGGFNHNLHSLRVVEYLEHPFPRFRGLNLTAATRAGLADHETRYDQPDAQAKQAPGRAPAADVHAAACGTESTGTGGGAPSVEAQVASWADRIAYALHDLEDAIGAGFLNLHELNALPLWHQAQQHAAATYGRQDAATADSAIHAIRRPTLDAMLAGLLLDIRTA
ncbi:MAG: dGTP triphosphohydrolase, partial [Vicinamibacterales bacterium]